MASPEEVLDVGTFLLALEDGRWGVLFDLLENLPVDFVDALFVEEFSIMGKLLDHPEEFSVVEPVWVVSVEVVPDVPPEATLVLRGLVDGLCDKFQVHFLPLLLLQLLLIGAPHIFIK